MEQKHQTNFNADNGKEYGLQPVVYDMAHKSLEQELEFLVNRIYQREAYYDPITIGDWGGGNAIVSKYILDTLKEKNISMTIIDNDTSKFIEHPKIKNIEANVCNYTAPELFDYSVSRNVLHYLSDDQQHAFMAQMIGQTKNFSLLINFSYEEKQKDEWKEFESKLYELKGIYRNFPTHDAIKEIIKKTPAHIWKENIIRIPEFDYFNFYKNRFNLNDKECAELSQIGAMDTREYDTSVFWISK